MDLASKGLQIKTITAKKLKQLVVSYLKLIQKSMEVRSNQISTYKDLCNIKYKSVLNMFYEAVWKRKMRG